MTRTIFVVLLAFVGAYGAEAAHPNMPVVINEIMASNGTIIRDPQQEYEDWVELYNCGDAPVDVGGMYLTDDLSAPTKWRIPTDAPWATTIPAGGYLLIWTDGDTADSGLHASFRLSDEGEDIGLFATDGITMVDGFSFGNQMRDISFGRYPDGDPNLQFMATPTPGTANVIDYEGVVQELQIDPPSRLCAGPITITLATPTEGATIYYTFDGTDPFSIARGRPFGAEYMGPIQVAGTATLRAVAWRPGWRQSPTRTERYVFAGLDLRGFSSPLPIAVIDTLGNAVGRPQVPAYAYFFDTDEQGKATVTGEIDFGGRGAINVRGKSSEGFPKKQYHLETWDEYNDDTDVSILGFPAGSDWVLQGPYSDKSLMRNVLAYGWSNDIGRYAVRTRFIEMFLNTDNTSASMSDYAGVYAFMEKIKIGPDRVDITPSEPITAPGSPIIGGYIIKKDKFDPDDQTFNTSRGQNLIYYDPNGADLTAQEKTWIRGLFNSFESALYGAGFADPVNGYARYIDVGSFIDHHIIVELCKNIDGFRLSTYMHIDQAGILHMGPVWDYNLSLGNADYLEGWLATGWYNRQLGDGDYPYWRRLFQDTEFQLRYADRWFELRRDLFTTDRLLRTIEDNAALLNEPQARNFVRWPILGRYIWPNWFIAKTWREEINWMKGWLTDRLHWMDGQVATEFAPVPPSFNQQGGYVSRGFQLSMSASSGAVYYTLDGSDPRLSTQPAGPTTTVRLVSENATKRILVPGESVADAWRGGAPFDDSTWTLSTGSPGGVGYETSSGYQSYITCDVRSSMYGRQTSCCLRMAFTIRDSIDDVSSLTLRVRYDDGFVAFLNGTEIARRNFVGEPAWNSRSSALNDDSAAVSFENISIANFQQALRKGDNILAVHALNESTTSSDFLISLELTAEKLLGQSIPSEVTRYTAPVPITQSIRVKARALNAGRWSALNEAVFAVGPVAESLRISEIMYHPLDAGSPNDPNTEYIELTNIGSESINLNFVKLTSGVDFTFPSVELSPGAYCLVVKDTAAFIGKHGPDLPVVGQYAGSLNNAGERIMLQDAAGTAIHDFRYEDNWFDITDGLGFSLTVKDPQTVDPNAYGSKSVWRPSARSGGSPGADESGDVRELGSVVINELLANSQGSGPDWIELHNTTDQAVDIGGWFLSDDADDFTKYQIAAGTSVAAGGYIVFYENRHFSNNADPGCHKPFALSSEGETVYLHSGSDGVVTGYSEKERFDASEPGVSLGRYRQSTGTCDFVALSEPTPDGPNATPLVGPVVISEIMYHPDAPADAEYVELLNISDAPVTLYDVEREIPWRFADDSQDPGVELLLPADPPVTLAAGEYLLLVKDLGAVNSRYAAPVGVQILAWGVGNLPDSIGRLQVSKPGDLDGDSTRVWIAVDSVAYSNGSHPQNLANGIDSWPGQADGAGSSLARIDPAAYGNDPINWQAATPSPGQLAAQTPRGPGPNR